MTAYLLKRLISLPLTLLGVSIVTFLFVRLIPGDAITAVNGKSTDGMDTNAITTLLKGPRGTHVKVSVTR